MKLITRGYALTLFVLFVLISPSAAVELDTHLQFLEPLIGTEWVGGYVGSESPDIQIELRFEEILGGRVVKYIREAEAADFSGLTHFYWNPGKGAVCFISLNNRGIVGEGVVAVEDGRIVLHGKSHRQDSTTEFKTTLEIDPKGILKDTFQRLESGAWVTGHFQEFVAKQ